ncbi:MAG TPA: PCRF domain-containing protein, partial [Thermoanaerobaculia bacterium]
MLEKLEEIQRKHDELRSRLSDPTFVQDHRAVREAQKTLAEIEPLVEKIGEERRIRKELAGARQLVESLPPG